MEECNELDSVAEESSQLVRSRCTTGYRDSSFSLRDLLNGQLMGPSITAKRRSPLCQSFRSMVLFFRRMVVDKS